MTRNIRRIAETNSRPASEKKDTLGKRIQKTLALLYEGGEIVEHRVRRRDRQQGPLATIKKGNQYLLGTCRDLHLRHRKKPVLQQRRGSFVLFPSGGKSKLNIAPMESSPRKGGEKKGQSFHPQKGFSRSIVRKGVLP